MENGYRIWTFYGALLADSPTEGLKQFLWRPRPPTLLSREEQRTIRRNLRDYSREFEEMDKEREEGANAAVIETRRRQYNEWYSWLESVREAVKQEREEEGRADPEEILQLSRTRSSGAADEVVEEVIDELIEETEEFV
jgi:translation initiation factor 3 subunit B